MDAYSSTAAARRYQSPQSALSSSARLKQSAGGGYVSNLGNLGGGAGASKAIAASKPRASSASITRRSNSKYTDNPSQFGGSGSFNFPNPLKGGGQAFGDPTSSAGGLYSMGNNQTGTSPSGNGGGFAADAGRMDSYDQIRRNYENSRNMGGPSGGTVNAASLLGTASAALVPRAQSASGARPLSAATPMTNNLTGNSAYLAMRQQTSSLGYNSNNGAQNMNYLTPTDTPPLLEGGMNSLFPPASLRNSAVATNSGLSRLGLNATRGMASGGSFSYNAGGSLLGLTQAEAQQIVNKGSTDIVPANYVLQPILSAKSSVTNIPKGTNGTATGKKVSFSTPLTSYTPLANPFMFQNQPAQAQQQGQQGQQGTSQPQGASGGRFAVHSANSSNNNARTTSPSPTLSSSSAASASTTLSAGAMTSTQPSGTGGYNSNNGINNGNNSNNNNTSSTASVSGNNNAGNSLLRPASASAALISSAAANHYRNSAQNGGNNGTNASHPASGVVNSIPVLTAGGVVLTGAAAVASNSRGGSPVTAGPVAVPINGFFNTGTSTQNAGSVNNNSNQSGANSGKPPLFLASVGASNYLDSSAGNIIKPTPTLMGLFKPSEPNASGTQSGNSTPTTGGAPALSLAPPGAGAAGPAAEVSPRSAMFPAIRTHTPSPVPSNAAAGLSSGGATGSSSNGSAYTPLFSNSPGKPAGTKGMVLSNSMDNFATYGLSKEDNQRVPGKGTAQSNAAVSDNASTGSSSGSNASSSGAELPRKASADSLTDLTFTRMAPPNKSNNVGNAPSPKAAQMGIAREENPWLQQARRDSVESAASSQLSEGELQAGRTGSAKGKKRAQRPSLAEQLAHLSTEGGAAGAKSADDAASLGTPKGAQDASFFSQSLNSALAASRGASNSSTKSPSPGLYDQNFMDDRLSPPPMVPASPSNTLYALPAKAYSIGNLSCRQPNRLCFYSDRCEYNFYHPNETGALNMVLYYTDMSAVSTVGTKLRFKVNAKAVPTITDGGAGPQLQVTVELTSSASMAIVRDRVIPLVNQGKT